MNQKGFSLAELLMVVAISGLLVSIAIPDYQLLVAKTHQSEVKGIMASMFEYETIFSAEFGSYTTEFDQLGWNISGPIQYNYCYGVYWPSPAPGAPNSRSWADPWVQCGFTNCQGGYTPPNQPTITCTAATYVPTWTCAEPYGAPPFACGTLTATTFDFRAGGGLNNSGVSDVWSITNTGNLTNLQNGL